MPTLFLSSHYSQESRRLRAAAEAAGWKVVRMDRPPIEVISDSPLPHAIYAPPKLAIQIAAEIHHQLLQCGDDWLPSLPEAYRLRSIKLATFEETTELSATAFIKPVRKGPFSAAVYSPGELKRQELDISTSIPVYLSDPVKWISEFRCFIAKRKLEAIAPYRINGELIKDLDDRLPVKRKELEEARAFCARLLADQSVPLPEGIVIDIGRIEGDGWAVVEANEAWAASIYSCQPADVLNCLLCACVPEAGSRREKSKR